MHKLFILSFIFLIFSCHEPLEKEVQKENFLSKEKMAAVLSDIFLLDETIQKSDTIDSLKILISQKYLKIFDIHKVTKEDFMKSHNYYVRFPGEMETIYTEAINNLSKIESELKAKE